MKKTLLSALLFSTLSFSQISNDSIASRLEDYLSSVDKFTGKKTYYSPYSENLSIVKVVYKKNDFSQFIKIDVKGSTVNYNCKGLIILFENGMKINRPNEVVETNYSDGFRYSVWFKPTAKEIALFKKYKITDVELYIYDAHISDYDATSFKDASEILLVAPKLKKK